MEYLYDKLIQLRDSDYYAFHMPGHKRNVFLTGADLPYKLDITEIDGFDDLHHPEGILLEAQRRAAELYHADETHYLINGSTVGLLCAVLGCTRKGDRILMARNCHKSVYNAVFLNELRPVYIYPELFSSGSCGDADLNGPVTVQQVEASLMENEDVTAVIITSPTYDGIVSDVAEIARCVHSRGIPLILDEAHGAHFGFHPYFPKNGNEHAADVVIHSLHKTLPSLTQTALLHINGTIADRDRIRMYLDILQSSSPSYVLMASLDECVRLLENKGKKVFEEYVYLLEDMRGELHHMKSLNLWETSNFDRSKILISTADCRKSKGEIKRYTGKQLSDELKEKYFLELEMSAVNYAIAMTSPGDTASGMLRLSEALYDIDGKLAKYRRDELDNAKYASLHRHSGVNKQIYSCGEIYKLTSRSTSVKYADCEGAVSLEYVYFYPPGIPLIVPGERISEETVRQIKEYTDAGFEIRGTKQKGMIEVLANG